MRPEDVLEGISKAQDAFSALGTLADRTEYLNNTLPMLAQSAVASNSSLEEMIGAAGEFSRQFGVTGRQASTAIAQQIAQGRFGSIGFKDEARYMGALGGLAGRFLATGPDAGLRSLNLTGALFQTAGQAGGTAGEAATRTRSFLMNMTSVQGQHRLTALLGHSAFDRSGQIITRQGESQQDAFARVMEEAYSRSRGSASAFTTALAGRRGEAQAIADQLRRDMSAHGGHAETFRNLLNAGAAATPENTQNAAFQALTTTDAVRRAQDENRQLFNLTGTNTRFASDTESQMRAFEMAHPTLGFVNNTVTRGMADIMNARMNSAAGPIAAVGTSELTRAAQSQATNEFERDNQSLSRMFGLGPSAEERSMQIQQRTEQIQSGLTRTANKVTNAAKDNGPMELSARTIDAIGNSVGRAVSASQHDAANTASGALSGATPTPPEARQH
jgi:hypothetical protein